MNSNQDYVYGDTGEIFNAASREDALEMARESYRGITITLGDILTWAEAMEDERLRREAYEKNHTPLSEFVF